MKRIKGVRPNQIPEDILSNPELARWMELVPKNYNFEIHKTLWRIRELNAKRVGLQFPEGLQMYGCLLSDILLAIGGLEDVIILADVVYGACCIEDLTANELHLDLLVHYGHSCLIPINETCMKTLYVFVDIAINIDTLVDTLIHNFPDTNEKIALVSTVQFVESVTIAKKMLDERGYTNFNIPQAKPRTTGELLGCTSPAIPEQIIISVSDGRFHLEAAMIQNPGSKFFRYDPYQNKIYAEYYDLNEMKVRRNVSIEATRNARHIGLVLGTLGRQGSIHILSQLEKLLQGIGRKYTVFLMSDVSQSSINKYPEVDAWVEIACPRLAIDWGAEFTKPMLNPYECFVAFKNLPLDYPMDNYMYNGGEWSVYTSKEIETKS
mmetsp:Transcript_3125/g.2843  ORF Transcript_3125/g.2843 Transcript_3125/m.2843 type:complete len:379 (+) Transcript_3125:16-1152(+)